ncbi:MAG: hypothetical protein IBJ18_09880 [Phycisphaerales bacterium]|nr:hypothetical protein [Phycisphaerales bacterium]
MIVLGSTSQFDDGVLVKLLERLRLVRIVAGLVVVLAFGWLSYSLTIGLEARRLTVPSESPAVTMPVVARSETREIDWSAFDAPIWNPRPAPQMAAPPPPPPPLRLKLLAVVVSSDRVPGSDADARQSRSALIYDPDLDEVITVHEGERIAGRLVKSIQSKRVILVEGTTERTVELEDAQSMLRPFDNLRLRIEGGT